MPRSYGSPPRASPRPHLIERRADLPAEPRAAAGRGAPAGAFAAGGAMPEFPWPPRQFFAKTRLDRDRLGNNRTRLRVVYRYLVQELNRAQFKETRLFQVGAYPENGFVVLTRLERADPAGVPLPGNRRWSRLGTPSSGDLLDQLGSLYLEPPGHYRMFAFVVARDQEVPEGGGPALHPAEAEVLVQSGWKDVPELPEPIAGFRFEGYYCHVLVYQFERTATDGTRVLRAARPAAAARQQLAAAGLKLTTEE